VGQGCSCDPGFGDKVAAALGQGGADLHHLSADVGRHLGGAFASQWSSLLHGAILQSGCRCREDHPAVVRVQPAAKWHMEFADRDLSVMVFWLHLQRSPVVAIVDCSVRGQFSRP